ncbi:hypothetical protein [Lysinibacillus sp. NPDC056185]|uniref:hypothetical protein n=1 Tax=Lysinibacillus sp. NPDC056185 TaxID=3345739 RepID=UPI0039F11DC3
MESLEKLELAPKIINPIASHACLLEKIVAKTTECAANQTRIATKTSNSAANQTKIAAKTKFRRKPREDRRKNVEFCR